MTQAEFEVQRAKDRAAFAAWLGRMTYGKAERAYCDGTLSGRARQILVALAFGALPDHASGVCPNCGQWQHKSTGDCLNECAARGFALAAEGGAR